MAIEGCVSICWIDLKRFIIPPGCKTSHKGIVSCAPNVSTIIQCGAAAALTGPQDCVVEMRQVYQHRRDLAISLLDDLGRYTYTPHGAFYVLIDVSGPDGTRRRGRQFALDLLRERNIAAAPGSTFGSV